MIITQQSAFDAYVVTPSDTTDLPNGTCKAIYIGDDAAADVEVMMQGGQTVVFANLASGVLHMIAAKRILSGNTSATDILALY